MSPFVLVNPFEAVSPRLMQLALAGGRLRQASLFVAAEVDEGAVGDILRYDLDDVLVSRTRLGRTWREERLRARILFFKK